MNNKSIIKMSLLVLLMMNALQVHAWQKCVVDGKIIYRKGICPSGASASIAKENSSQPAADAKQPEAGVQIQEKTIEPTPPPPAEERNVTAPDSENKVWSNKNIITAYNERSPQSGSSQEAIKKFVGSALLFIGSVINLVGFVFWLKVTFRAGLLWGIGCLIFPFLCLFFAVLNWNDSKKPALYTFAGSILWLMGASLVDVRQLLGL